MLSSITQLYHRFSPPTYPSILIIVGEINSYAQVLHVVPEDGFEERLDYMRPGSRTFRKFKTKETSREQLGLLHLHAGEDIIGHNFIKNVANRVNERWSSKTTAENVATNDLEQALRSAALDLLGDIPPLATAESVPVYLAYVSRPSPGRIRPENYQPRSIAD